MKKSDRVKLIKDIDLMHVDGTSMKKGDVIVVDSTDGEYVRFKIGPNNQSIHCSLVVPVIISRPTHDEYLKLGEVTPVRMISCRQKTYKYGRIFNFPKFRNALLFCNDKFWEDFYNGLDLRDIEVVSIVEPNIEIKPGKRVFLLKNSTNARDPRSGAILPPGIVIKVELIDYIRKAVIYPTRWGMHCLPFENLKIIDNQVVRINRRYITNVRRINHPDLSYGTEIEIGIESHGICYKCPLTKKLKLIDPQDTTIGTSWPIDNDISDKCFCRDVELYGCQCGRIVGDC